LETFYGHFETDFHQARHRRSPSGAITDAVATSAGAGQTNRHLINGRRDPFGYGSEFLTVKDSPGSSNWMT
jgi:hypothetical protein